MLHNTPTSFNQLSSLPPDSELRRTSLTWCPNIRFTLKLSTQSLARCWSPYSILRSYDGCIGDPTRCHFLMKKTFFIFPKTRNVWLFSLFFSPFSLRWMRVVIKFAFLPRQIALLWQNFVGFRYPLDDVLICSFHQIAKFLGLFGKHLIWTRDDGVMHDLPFSSQSRLFSYSEQAPEWLCF